MTRSQTCPVGSPIGSLIDTLGAVANGVQTVCQKNRFAGTRPPRGNLRVFPAVGFRE